MQKGLQFLLGLFAIPLLSSGCVTKENNIQTTPVSFAIEVVSTPTQCDALEESPCPFSMDTVTFHVDITAINSRGAPDTSYNDTVLLSLVPSGILPREGEGVYTLPDGRKAVAVPMTNGRATDVPITFKAAFGKVQFIVEDMGYRPIQITNDCQINGTGCPACWGEGVLAQGCFQADDDNPKPGQGGAGVSKTLHFLNPTVADVQYVEDTPDAIETSPLGGFRVTVDGVSPNDLTDMSDCIDGNGDPRELLVITAVTSDGFFVTDVCNNGGPVHAPDTWRSFGSLFAFNFHAPDDLVTGDCVTWFQGGSNDFYGFTELKNPAWSSPVCLEGAAGCQPSCMDYLPEPFVLDAATLSNDYTMEGLESSLVAVENGTIGFSQSCDFDGNGQIDYEDQAEKECKYDCQDEADCWVLEDYKDYFQFTVHVGSGELALVLQGVVAFNPLEHEGENLSYVAGTIKHLSFGGPPWMLYPRNEGDFQF